VKLRRLAELSALMTLYADQIAVPGRPISNGSLQPYLAHSRQRHQLWRTQLDELRRQSSTGGDDFAADCRNLTEEMLVSELLTRTWTAILAASDQRCDHVHAEPIGRHVLVGLLELRIELLTFVTSQALFPLGTLVTIDRLRRRCDRWSDLLIGELARNYDVLEFAPDRQRAADFAQLPIAITQAGARLAWQLIERGIHAAMPNTEVPAETEETHEGVMAAVLSALPRQAFDTPGEYHTRWIRRLATNEPLDTPAVPTLPADRPLRPGSRSVDLPATAAVSFRKLFRHLGLDGQ
jgi:hypothetical protein